MLSPIKSIPALLVWEIKKRNLPTYLHLLNRSGCKTLRLPNFCCYFIQTRDLRNLEEFPKKHVPWSVNHLIKDHTMLKFHTMSCSFKTKQELLYNHSFSRCISRIVYSNTRSFFVVSYLLFFICQEPSDSTTTP